MTTNTAKQRSNNAQKVLDTLEILRRTAAEIRSQNIAGWGNAVDEAIALIHSLEGAIEPMAKGEAVACQYALDVAMPEYRCVGKCQYDTHPQPAESWVSEAEIEIDRWLNLNSRSAGTFWDITTLVVPTKSVRELFKGKRLAPESRECIWIQTDANESGTFDTGCGKVWGLVEGTPASNEMFFCHACGKPIKALVYRWSEATQEDELFEEGQAALAKGEGNEN